MAEGRPAEWFNRIVEDGFSALIVLRLPAAPYTDKDMEKTLDVWIQVLWSASAQWAENLDSRRIEQAFMKLCRTVDRWPAPRSLLDALPARPQPKALPAPSMSCEQRQANSARLRAMLKEALGHD